MDEGTAKIMFVVVGAALTSIPLFPLVLWRLAAVERTRAEERVQAEKRRSEEKAEAEKSERRLEAAIEDLREAIKGLGERLEPSAGHAFSIAAQAKAIDILDKESNRAREWIHKLRTSTSTVIFLLHLMRRGVPVPAAAIDKIATELTAAEDATNGEDPTK